VKSEKRKVKNIPLSILAVFLIKTAKILRGTFLIQLKAEGKSSEKRKVINEQRAHLSLFVYHCSLKLPIFVPKFKNYLK
jgi:hypothetical protein